MSNKPLKTLFLHPPSFDGFDGGAGSRYQAKREIKSFRFPALLAPPPAMGEVSRFELFPKFGIVGKRGGTGLHYDKFVIPRVRTYLLDRQSIRRRIQQTRTFHHRGGLRQPGRKPE